MYWDFFYRVLLRMIELLLPGTTTAMYGQVSGYVLAYAAYHVGPPLAHEIFVLKNVREGMASSYSHRLIV